MSYSLVGRSVAIALDLVSFIEWHSCTEAEAIKI